MNTKAPLKMLFMSADIANSTSFKQSSNWANSDDSWLPAFEMFFRDFPLVLTGQSAISTIDLENIPSISIWKVIGDEMVFKAPFNTAEEALRLTEAFYRAVVSYDATFFGQWPLRIRGTCWACEFSGRNIELEIPEMEDTRGAYIDYLGADVDTGFRLSHYGEPGTLIVSMELAEIIALNEASRGQIWHYTGSALLKGVLGGRPYPLIFITFEDMKPDLWRWEATESAQMKSLRDDPPINSGELVELIRKIREYVNKSASLGLKQLGSPH